MPQISARDPHPRQRTAVLDSEMHYVDLGDPDMDPIVFLHVNPTSSYLWRNILPMVADLGRCLVPDLISMGQSGKAPAGRYRFHDQAHYLDAWFEALKLTRNVSLVLHDWGSALGFHRAHRFPHQIKAVAYMESLVQPRLWSDFPAPRAELFRAWRGAQGEKLALEDNLFIETVLPKSVLRPLSEAEMNAYRAPFIQPGSRLPTLT